MVINKKLVDMRSETLHNVCGGTGNVPVHYLLEGEELQGKFTKLAHMYVSPGATFGSHAHLSGKEGLCAAESAVDIAFENAEMYIVLKGEIWTGAPGEEMRLTPGDVSFTTAGSIHCLQNRSDETAEVLAVLTP